MNGGRSDGADTPHGFEVAEGSSVEVDVVEAEIDEDEEAKRAREAAFASTFDPELAHAGRTDEEMIEERQDETRLLVDVAIVAGVALTLHESSGDKAQDVEMEDGAQDANESG